MVWWVDAKEKLVGIFANFGGLDPQAHLVEISVRQTCFYPLQPHRNFVTVEGFEMCHAATPWAAPTAEQVGLLGTHYSRGWIIRNNVVHDSRCSGITLGKDRATGHNVWSNDPSKDGATHYNEVIERALAGGWSRETVGSHLVQGNEIYRCEQTGICGSLGAIFSRMIENDIHDIWIVREFGGAEMAGIKLHGAIDGLIADNRIVNTGRGLWLDWMTQGTRVTRNLFYDNTTDDIFVEVNHGPFLIDNNIFLSQTNLRDWSEGGAVVHNYFGGLISSQPVLNRSTPYHPPHSTQVAGLAPTQGGDYRFVNNIFAGAEADRDSGGQNKNNEHTTTEFGIASYADKAMPSQASGNVFWGDAKPMSSAAKPLDSADLAKSIQLTIDDRYRVGVNLGAFAALPSCKRLVDTASLGKAVVPGVGFVNPSSEWIVIDQDYFGRSRTTPTLSGPFAFGTLDSQQLWPKLR